MSYSINPGDSAPDIELPVWPLGQMKLSDLRGRWVVLYFYPKDRPTSPAWMHPSSV